MTSLLTARAVHKSFARTEALRGVSLEVTVGEAAAVTGPSDSGKSTLLLCLAGILRPESGEVWYDGRRLDQMGEADRSVLRRGEFGIVLQFGQLLAELTVVQNVAAAAFRGHGRAESHWAARSWLERLGVVEIADASPAETVRW